MANEFEENRQRNAELGAIKKIQDTQRDSARYNLISLLLSYQCPSEVQDNGVHHFEFPLHCDGKIIVAATKDAGEWVIVTASLTEDDDYTHYLIK